MASGMGPPGNGGDQGGGGGGGANPELSMSSMIREVQGALAGAGGGAGGDKYKMEDGEGYLSPFANLEKAAVLQEARIFHDPNRVREDARQCCTVIAQLLHLQNTGQILNSTESTEVFFGVTKLFMSEDASLRRMVYLFIKEMAESCNPDDVIIVTSSLTKDMTCDVDLYRANALRVLAKIVDSSMLGAIERYVKQAIVDSSTAVGSAALVSSSQLFASSPECAAIVKRWISETQEAVQSSNEMVQYQALQLMYQIKSHDRLGVSKLVTQWSGRSLRSPLANVLLVRFTSKLIRDEYDDGKGRESTLCRQGYQYLESALQHKDEMVVYEAARAICSLPEVEPQDLNPAVNVLQLFLSSPKPAVRFASVKTLAEVSATHPRVVSKCNEDLEALIGDANRSIGTLAITTLLKTGSQNSVDRLLKQISVFLADIADEYKITVVRSLQQLCLTYPSKHRVLIGFLSNFLREEGGFEFKRCIVSSIVSLMNSVPETTETSLMHLCEFIEDCEFTMLSTQILHLLGERGPSTSQPARYIRFVYNRVILENAAVRAAAVEALVKFASKLPSLRTSIVSLLRRCLEDEDDETRDRAAVAVKVLERAMAENPYVAPSGDDDGEEVEASDVPTDAPAPDDLAAFVYLENLPMSFDRLERSLKAYVSTPNAMVSSDKLEFASLPIVEDVAADAVEEGVPTLPGGVSAEEDVVAAGGAPSQAKREVEDPAAAVYAIPDLAALGRVFRSSKPVELTESETEYVVTCVKHILPTHVVLQFYVQNTIDDQRLDEVTVSVEGSDGGELFDVTGEISADRIPYGETKSCFTVLRRNEGAALAPITFACELHFHVVQVDPSTGEEEGGGDSFAEEYPLEDLEVSTSDFMAKVASPDFRKSWEGMGNANEVLEKFALQFKNLDDAVSAVVGFLGLQPCDGTGVVKANLGNKPHMLHLSGVFVGGTNVLARAQLGLDTNAGVVLKIAVRSDDAAVSRLVADCIQ